MIRLRRNVPTGQEPPELRDLPRGYGLAWYDPAYGRAVCYLVPFNLVAGWARGAWMALALRWAPKPSAYDFRVARAYFDGCEVGRREGYKEGLADATRAWNRSHHD